MLADDQVGLAEQLSGAERQQALVAGSGADQRDPASGGRSCAVSGTRFTGGRSG
jgi:hypothetical protein